VERPRDLDREYVVTAIADSADTDAVARRLFKNQEHIGAAIVPFYGMRQARP
jgi:hypothetical protein